MNKYLLLRDNKQSGPYTVPEIITIGIKPYDLVWLEGKSAAWRYPSEVEELKAYAPAVEEQPFDRFYKKPPAKAAVPVSSESNPVAETVAINCNNAPIAEKHEAYQPKIAVAHEDETPAKKVYINFPAKAPAANVSTTFPEKVREVKSHETAPVEKKKIVAIDDSPIPARQTTRFENEPLVAMKEPVRKKDNKMLQVALAACVLLGIISVILFFNYSRQRETLNELNTLVRNIENREKQQQAIPSSLVQNDAPAEPTPEPPSTAAQEASIVPETVTDKPAAEKHATPRPLTPAKNSTSSTEENSPVVFRENKPGERPVERRGQASTEILPAAAEPASKENLYALVNVKPNAYKTGLLGGISNLKLNLDNKSDVQLHRVAVEVKFLGPEKKVVKKQTIYFENVAPGGESTIDVPKSNRGVTIEYTITDIKS